MRSLRLLAGDGHRRRAKQTPRELYNEGAQSLEKGYLREAESCLLRATAANLESLQPPALYDLGHVRFRLGQELLKGEQPRQPMLDRAENAHDDGQDAIREADRALKDDDLNHIIGAYNAGRGMRKPLRLANEETMRALDLYGAVLMRWKRSVGDFRSTVELRADDHDAQFNADVVQRHIDELQKQMQELADKKEQVGKTRAELKKKLAELRKKIPDGMIQPGQGEPDDEDDDDDEPKDPKKPDSGFKDELGREGDKRGITPRDGATDSRGARAQGRTASCRMGPMASRRKRRRKNAAAQPEGQGLVKLPQT